MIHLFLNDSLVQKIQPDKGKLADNLAYPPFHFKFRSFKPGILKAVGYIHGKAVAEDIVTTPKKASEIDLEVDKSTIELSKETADLVFVYARIIDKNGNICPLNSDTINFNLDGKGELIGMNPVCAEAGIATILLKTRPGEKYVIHAKSKELNSANLVLE
jgi:beta-galactosidase